MSIPSLFKFRFGASSQLLIFKGIYHRHAKSFCRVQHSLVAD